MCSMPDATPFRVWVLVAVERKTPGGRAVLQSLPRSDQDWVYQHSLGVTTDYASWRRDMGLEDRDA